jgi:hypothetical protein
MLQRPRQHRTSCRGRRSRDGSPWAGTHTHGAPTPKEKGPDRNFSGRAPMPQMLRVTLSRYCPRVRRRPYW